MGFFTGKTAIVTGAGSGIGRALALALADAGCAVAITDIVQERLDSVLRELESKGTRAGGYRVDHSRREEVEAFAARFFQEWGRVDILCSNAGVGHGGWYTEMPLEDWEWVLGINLWGAIYMMHYFVPRMIEQGGGSILLTASDAGLVAMPGMTAYNASKYAVVGMGETLRIELSEHNIRVSLLCPGDIDTNIIRDGKVYLYDRKGRSAKPEIEKYYRTRGVPPEVVAEAALRGLERDRAVIVVPWIHHGPLILLRRISPQLYHALMRFALRKGIVHKMFGIQR
ncbi:MAG: SDR family oxidoreductase [Actinobacteria bacterium]|nr:SDR family oxidoreductase [Actinomycetota bacterium]